MFAKLFGQKNRAQRPLPRLTPQREAQFITIDEVKSALADNDFGQIVGLFELFINRDLKIAEGVEKRQNALSALTPHIEAGSREKALIDKLFQRVPVSEWLLSMSEAIYYGYALIEPQWEAVDGLLLPSKIINHAPTVLREDEQTREHYILSSGSEKKLTLDTLHPRLLIYKHARSGDHIQNRALAYKLLYYALLKHVTIGYNIQYFDSLAIPPIIVKSANISDEDMQNVLMDALSILKSNSFGIFPDNVEIDTIKAGTQADFLGTIKYFDALIAQYIVGATSVSDGSAGSMALAKIQNERFLEKVSFDAARVAEGLESILNTALALNLSSFTPIKVTLPVYKQLTPQEFTDMVAKLKQSGYTVGKEEIERRLGIKLTKDDTTTKPSLNHKEINTPQEPKHLSIQESIIDNEDLTPIEAELNKAYEILQESSSYEEALSQIESYDNPALEKALERLIFANGVIGMLEDNSGNDTL